MRIGEKIRKIREMKGITQEYVASELKITAQAFGKIEREETKLDFQRLEEIARLLDIDPLDIVNFDESRIFYNTFSNRTTLDSNSIRQSNYGMEKIIELLQQELIQMREINKILLQFLDKQNLK